MQRPIDNLENGMLLFDDDDEPRLSQYDIDFENQDDDRGWQQWLEDEARGEGDKDGTL